MLGGPHEWVLWWSVASASRRQSLLAAVGACCAGKGHVWPWNSTSPRRRAFHSIPLSLASSSLHPIPCPELALLTALRLRLWKQLSLLRWRVQLHRVVWRWFHLCRSRLANVNFIYRKCQRYLANVPISPPTFLLLSSLCRFLLFFVSSFLEDSLPNLLSGSSFRILSTILSLSRIRSTRWFAVANLVIKCTRNSRGKATFIITIVRMCTWTDTCTQMTISDSVSQGSSTWQPSLLVYFRSREHFLRVMKMAGEHLIFTLAAIVSSLLQTLVLFLCHQT